MKKTAISVLASAAILGGILTGCGNGTASSGVGVKIQASVVEKVAANGLTISDSVGTDCINDVAVTASNEIFTLTTSNMQAVDGQECGILNSDFLIEVNPTKAETTEGVKLSDKIGTTPLKGYKGKAVNVFSTIAVENGVSTANFEEIDVNKSETKEEIEGIKDLLQLALSQGGVNSIKNVKLDNIREIADKKEGVTLDTTVIAALDTIKDALGNTLNIGSLGLTDIQKVKVVKNDSGKLEFQDKDGNVNSDLTKGLDASVDAKKIIVNSVSIKVGDATYKASKDNFLIKANTPTVTANSEVSFVIDFEAINNPEDTVNFIFEIKKGSQEVKLTITNVEIATKTIKLTSASTQVTFESNASKLVTAMGGSTLSKGLKSDLTNTDGTFDLMTVLNALGNTNSQTVTNIKAAILDYVQDSATYNVEVKVEGVNSDIKTNLDENSEINGVITLTAASSSSSTSTGATTSSEMSSSSEASSSSTSSTASSSSEMSSSSEASSSSQMSSSSTSSSSSQMSSSSEASSSSTTAGQGAGSGEF